MVFKKKLEKHRRSFLNCSPKKSLWACQSSSSRTNRICSTRQKRAKSPRASTCTRSEIGRGIFRHARRSAEKVSKTGSTGLVKTFKKRENREASVFFYLATCVFLLRNYCYHNSSVGVNSQFKEF